MHPFFAVEIVMRRQLQKPPLQQQQRADDPAEESVSNTGLYVATVASLAIGVVGGAVVNRMFGNRNNDMTKEELETLIKESKRRNKHFKSLDGNAEETAKIPWLIEQVKRQHKHIRELQNQTLKRHGRVAIGEDEEAEDAVA